MKHISRRECLKLAAIPLLGNLMGTTGSRAAEERTQEKEDRARSKRARLPAERTCYTDADTGRKVMLWTAPGAGHNVGFYYHQNPFDTKRNLVYFVSDRTGSWQLWRAHLGDGRLEQVSEFAGLGRIRRGADVNQHGANYWVYVSPRSGRAYLGGESRIAAIDPDTLGCRILDWQENGTIPARPLCRTEYPPPGGVGGMECNPNVHVAPDGKSVFFTTYRDGKACLASVEAGP